MTKDIDLSPMKEQLRQIDEELKNPLPTPPIGSTVVWYPRAAVEEGNRVAAIVTNVEGPGKLTLTVFKPLATPDPTRRGCLHVSHPVHEKRANSVSINAGAWDYPDDVIPGKSHYDLHVAALNKKRDSLVDQIANASAIQTAQSAKGRTQKQESPA